MSWLGKQLPYVQNARPPFISMMAVDGLKGGKIPKSLFKRFLVMSAVNVFCSEKKKWQKIATTQIHTDPMRLWIPVSRLSSLQFNILHVSPLSIDHGMLEWA